MSLQYNTQQKPIMLREYGRNVQKIVQHICDEPNKEKRNQMIVALKGLIEKLSTTSKESIENTRRIWDDMHIISNFELDVDSPYPPPQRDILQTPPRKMEYPQNKSLSRYGRNIEKLVKNIMEKDDPQKREEGTMYLGRLINTFHSSWNKGSIDKAGILKNIEKISDNKLTIAPEKIERENLFEKLSSDNRRSRNSSLQTQKKERKTGGKRYGGGFRR